MQLPDGSPWYLRAAAPGRMTSEQPALSWRRPLLDNVGDAMDFNGALVRALCQRDPGLGSELATRFLHVMGNRLQAARRRLEDCQRAAGHHDDL